MMEFDPTKVTFADIDREKGIVLLEVEGEEYPLPAWYRSVYHVRLCDLSLGDLCRACAQGIHPEYIIPLVLPRLRENPNAGESYEGQLVFDLNGVPIEYWMKYPEHSEEVKNLVQKSFNLFDVQTQQNAHTLFAKLGRTAGGGQV